MLFNFLNAVICYNPKGQWLCLSSTMLFFLQYHKVTSTRLRFIPISEGFLLMTHPVDRVIIFSLSLSFSFFSPSPFSLSNLFRCSLNVKIFLFFASFVYFRFRQRPNNQIETQREMVYFTLSKRKRENVMGCHFSQYCSIGSQTWSRTAKNFRSLLFLCFFSLFWMNF